MPLAEEAVDPFVGHVEEYWAVGVRWGVSFGNFEGVFSLVGFHVVVLWNLNIMICMKRVLCFGSIEIVLCGMIFENIGSSIFIRLIRRVLRGKASAYSESFLPSVF